MREPNTAVSPLRQPVAHPGGGGLKGQNRVRKKKIACALLTATWHYTTSARLKENSRTGKNRTVRFPSVAHAVDVVSATGHWKTRRSLKMTVPSHCADIVETSEIKRDVGCALILGTMVAANEPTQGYVEFRSFHRVSKESLWFSTHNFASIIIQVSQYHVPDTNKICSGDATATIERDIYQAIGRRHSLAISFFCVALYRTGGKATVY